MVPTLETARLRLRAYRASDLDDHAAALADPEVMRFIGGQPSSREEAWRRMLMAPGMWALLGYGFWAVERKDDSRWVGQIGFGDFQRDMEPRLSDSPEMGWVFAREAHGQGYASEALTAAIGWGDGHLPGQPFSAIIAPGNRPSIRVAEKAGFRHHLTAQYKGEPILVYLRSPAASAAASSTAA